MRVLVVEDEKRLAAALKGGLEEEGFAVDVALDGEQGLWMASEMSCDATAVAYGWLGLNAVVAFWIAYVLTRPLGASFADWLGVSKARGALNLGADHVSLAAAVLIVGLVVHLTSSGRRAERATRNRVHRRRPVRRLP
jgi:uncharacterized membrane-anchored protein